MAIVAVIGGLVATWFVRDRSPFVFLPWLCVWLAGFGCVFAFYAEENRRRRLAGWRYRPLHHAKAWTRGVVIFVVLAVGWTAWLVGQWAGSHWNWFGSS